MSMSYRPPGPSLLPNFCIDTTVANMYISAHIAAATQARANMRGVLKECKRMDSSERDYLKIIKVLDDYLPHLYGLIACVASGEIRLKHEPVFSWRTTLSSTLFHTSPRLTLLTYSMALSNFSHSVRAITEKERKDKDERLNFGVLLLCRASGVCGTIAEGVLGEMALADAQTLAIRKLLSKAAFDSTLSPAKLHLECAALYSSARTLAMTPAKASSGSGLRATEVSADLLKYLEKETKFHTALAHKWLGWAQQELEDLAGSGFSKGLSLGRGGGKDKDGEGKAVGGREGVGKVRVEVELKSVKVFLGHYQKMNDSLMFDPVPKQSELQAVIPEGRMAVSAKAYVPPIPAFGPGSRGYEARTRAMPRDQEEDEWRSLEQWHLRTPDLSPSPGSALG
ncbi:hypothetical protein BU15DRAFT_88724 [Melanogaster broomeanus]|nr:hypothetical protein BU15DRAFT_88724 [Melanogaster broomeanus]